MGLISGLGQEPALLASRGLTANEFDEALPVAIESEQTRAERGHADIRIARRAETIARLAAVAHERGEVSDGLRRVLVVQAVRLAYLAAVRLAFAEGRPAPEPGLIDTAWLVGGTVLYEPSDPTGEHRNEEDMEIESSDD